MKIQVKKKPIFSLLLFILSPYLATGQTFTERELIERTFKAEPGITVEVNNKYGKIHVLPWDKDSVKFEIDLIINSNSLSRMQRIKRGINFDFTSTRHYVTAITDFGNTGNQVFAELRNLSEALIPGKNTIEINYRVYCPESLNLSVINKFGDIYIDDLKGNVNISLSNGDMKINNLDGSSQIELNFGNAVINKVKDSRMTLSYSDVNIKEAIEITAITKSSTLTLDDINLLKLDSRRDNFFITSINTLQGSSDFSQFWIDELICDADIDLKFGDMTIEKVNQHFCNLNISSEYADLTLYVDPRAVYEADIFHSEDVSLTLPAEKHELGLTTVKKSENELHSFYKTGNSESLPGIRIQALHKCYLNIINK